MLRNPPTIDEISLAVWFITSCSVDITSEMTFMRPVRKRTLARLGM
jgi:hypothetical protein